LNVHSFFTKKKPASPVSGIHKLPKMHPAFQRITIT
jgi:hypothetical protein